MMVYIGKHCIKTKRYIAVHQPNHTFAVNLFSGWQVMVVSVWPLLGWADNEIQSVRLLSTVWNPVIIIPLYTQNKLRLSKSSSDSPIQKNIFCNLLQLTSPLTLPPSTSTIWGPFHHTATNFIIKNTIMCTVIWHVLMKIFLIFQTSLFDEDIP